MLVSKSALRATIGVAEPYAGVGGPGTRAAPRNQFTILYHIDEEEHCSS
jgi:hypothetical protein